MSLVLKSSGGGSVSLNEPVTGATVNLQLPSASGTLLNSSEMANFSPVKTTGSTPVTATVPVAIYSLTSVGAYQVYVNIDGLGTSYRSLALITVDSSNADLTMLKIGGSLDISLSGNTIIVTSATTGTVTWIVTKA
jgi:hypothetical protein